MNGLEALDRVRQVYLNKSQVYDFQDLRDIETQLKILNLLKERFDFSIEQVGTKYALCISNEQGYTLMREIFDDELPMIQEWLKGEQNGL